MRHGAGPKHSKARQGDGRRGDIVALYLSKATAGKLSKIDSDRRALRPPGQLTHDCHSPRATRLFQGRWRTANHDPRVIWVPEPPRLMGLISPACYACASGSLAMCLSVLLVPAITSIVKQPPTRPGKSGRGMP